jgi:chemotaxis family two-component system response regulator Rcp1
LFEASSANEILLVEDNAGDVRLFKEALKEGSPVPRLAVVSDGEEALAYLRHQGKYVGAARPALVLLDLNLPRRDGRQVLAEIKGDPGLRSIPVIILTNSKAERDVTKTYQLGANCYVAKPVDWSDFLAAVKEIQTFWLTIATLPRD